MNNRLFPILMITALTSCTHDVPQLGKAPVDEVIKAMTIEEKANVVIGSGMEGFTGDEAVIGATLSLVPGAAGTTYAIPRLGIPAIALADGPAGLRINPTREGDKHTYYCTHFPIATLLASTWNQELVEKVGAAIGNEALEYGADILLAPALNIRRHPLCGRNFEYYSEDPFVSGEIAAAYVRGVQRNGVGTSIKHFAANNQETNRMGNDSRVSQRALREIYLKGFEIAVKESEPWTVMSSYNYINGVYASESKELLTTLLRDEWGFKGAVMTDWFGGKDALAQMEAGNDMLQPGTDKQRETIVEGVRTGKLDESVLDRNVKRILELIQKTPRFKKYEYSNSPDLEAHAELTRQAASEGMVLLKNEKETLPLPSAIKRISVFGCSSYEFVAGGAGSGNVNRAYTVSLLDGLRNAGYTVDESLKPFYDTYIKEENRRNAPDPNNKYAQFMPTPRPVEMSLTVKQIQYQANMSDVAIVTLGRMSGEFLDRTSADFNLSREERLLLEDVCNIFHTAGKRVIVILNIGDVIETASWKELPDAILCAWQAGQEGGNSVADILAGKVSPSGKLPITFPNRLEDATSYANFPIDQTTDIDVVDKGEKSSNRKNIDYTNYEEDIYVGYRYFDTFGKQVSYPFGYGLSYTDFEYSKPSIKKQNGIFTITLQVKNTGRAKGKEIAQLYVASPEETLITKPEKDLKAFAKTKELRPGESAIISLSVKEADLAYYDEATAAWTTEAGVYQFLIGASSRDIRTTLQAEVSPMTVSTYDLLKLQSQISVLKKGE